MKTASRMLGTVLFRAGYEVQDAPRYGAERRGAPIFAYVRASRERINERGIIISPDLVIVSDDSLVALPSAAILQGITDRTVLFIVSSTAEKVWKKRLNTRARIVCLSPPGGEVDPLHDRFAGALCVGAAARLMGNIDFQEVEAGIRKELGKFHEDLVNQNVGFARRAFDDLENVEGCAREGEPLHVEDHQETGWIKLDLESINLAAPVIFEGANSIQVRTGLWRTMRPVIEYDRCKKCNWVCSNYCPDNAITVNEDGFPEIDLDHCKGCMICVVQCPPHAIVSIAESEAMLEEEVS
jgi:pyruvate ferredoxin oxidoreductase gamma subunit